MELNTGKVVVEIEMETLEEKVVCFVINPRTSSRSDWVSNQEILKCSSEISSLSKLAFLDPRLTF